MFDDIPIFADLHQGVSNRFARSALNAIAHCPDEIYNPLWLYGPSGTGKTALLDATAAALRDHPSSPLILHIQAEQLVHDMIRAIEHNRTEEFKERILGFQVILVDHMDTLIYQAYTQKEVGLLLAKAAHQGIQVILVSACKPEELDALDQMFEKYCPWLLHCDVSAPDMEERLVITRRMAQAQALPLSDQMVCRIADGTRTPAQIQCVIQHLAARRKLLQLEDDALSEALDHLLPKEAEA